MRGCLFLILALFFSACSLKQNIVFDYVDDNISSNSFEAKMLRGAAYELDEEFDKAAQLYTELFKAYKEPILLEKAFTLAIFNKLDNQEELFMQTKSFLLKNSNLTRLAAIYLIEQNRLKEAKALLNELVKREKDFRTYEILGNLSIQEQNLHQALRYYLLSKKFLNQPNELLSLKIAEIELLLGKNKEAQAELEDFVAKQTCTPRICLPLAQIYVQNNQIKKLKELYIKLYESTGDTIFIKQLVEICVVVSKDYKEALNYYTQYHLEDDEMKLFIYDKLDMKAQSLETLMKLYESTGEKKYLLNAAVFEFELGTKNNSQRADEKLLQSVIHKFRLGIDEESEAVFLNYYGYLLIDYDRDIDEGIALVELALRQDSTNLYYLDSLAWGFYKKNECQKAWDIMLQTLHDSEFSAQDESKEHIKAIKQCLDKGQK